MLAHNPLGKIPVLLGEGGEVLFDSSVACEYLSHLAGDQQWLPALQRQAQFVGQGARGRQAGGCRLRARPQRQRQAGQGQAAAAAVGGKTI